MNLRPHNSGDFLINRASSSILSAFMSRVYSWMMLGILVTGFVSYVVGNNPDLVAQIFSNRPFFWAVIIVQLASVFFLSAMIERISTAAAAITFLMYSALTGLTLSLIFVTYTEQSIASAFVTTAAGFGGLSLYGYTTKRDLGPVGTFCIIALVGLLMTVLISYFVPVLNSNSNQTLLSVAFLLVFAGLTAYDTQRIKAIGANGGGTMSQLAIYGALVLYLDFINLFLNLLRLMGDRK